MDLYGVEEGYHKRANTKGSLRSHQGKRQDSFFLKAGKNAERFDMLLF